MVSKQDAMAKEALSFARMVARLAKTCDGPDAIDTVNGLISTARIITETADNPDDRQDDFT